MRGEPPGGAPFRGPVLVTGASRGLGLETALILAERGHDVWASMRDPGRAAVEAAARARGVRLEVLRLDVTDPGSVRAAVAAMVEARGGIGGVVNNAGTAVRGYFEDLSAEEIRRVFEVNVFGTMTVTREVLPHLRAAGRGRIVMVSSVAGRIGSMALTPYVASKFALEGFGESLSLEVAPLGVQVVIVEPGIVETEIWGDGNVAARARDVQGLYHGWFRRVEAEALALVRSSPIQPADVARVIAHVLAVGRPRLRYVVGRRAGLLVALRRHLPGELFERLYFAEVLRRVTGRRSLDAPGC